MQLLSQLCFSCIAISPIMLSTNLFAASTPHTEVEALRAEVAELRKMVELLTQSQQKTEIQIAKVEKKTQKKRHSNFDIPEIQIKGFGHLQHDYARHSAASGSTKESKDTNNFVTGGVDLFLTSQIADNLSFLNETIFEFGEGGENILDVERVLLKYEYADWLNIAIGRGHTALGFWNHHFHHGTWLYTTTDRPLIYRFEDEGGILPVHFVGLEFSGNQYIDQLGSFSYVANIANGRGKITDSVQLKEDLNNDKQLSFMFTFEPSSIEGLGLGANILYDIIPENDSVVGRDSEIEEIIAGTHLFYIIDEFEIIGEYQFINHNPRKDSRGSNTHSGGYLQMAYSFNKLKPYYRFDFLEIDPNDFYFIGLEGVEDTISHTFGLRYEWFPYAALKLEYRMMDTDTVDSHEITSQVSFAF